MEDGLEVEDEMYFIRIFIELHSFDMKGRSSNHTLLNKYVKSKIIKLASSLPKSKSKFELLSLNCIGKTPSFEIFVDPNGASHFSFSPALDMVQGASLNVQLEST